MIRETTSPHPKAPAHDAAALRVIVPPNKGHFITEGEKKFDRHTYKHVGYIINALLSVAAVFAIERTGPGQRMMEAFVAKVGKLPHVNPERARLLATKSFFLSGGFAVLLPMKFLEDAKLNLITKWNRKIYGPQAETDPAILQSEHEIAEAPKQTWSSVFSSRALALVPFYATVGLLWDRKSLLSKWTNPDLRELSKDAIKAMEKTDPSGFSHLAGKGVYFDRPIAAVSRAIGKIAAKLTGMPAAGDAIRDMEQTYPGMIKQWAKDSPPRDPIHSSLPYYFISEAITSGMVAWGVYMLTRVMGPIFDKKHPTPVNRTHINPVLPTIHIDPQLPEKEETPQPLSQIKGKEIEHQPPLALVPALAK